MMLRMFPAQQQVGGGGAGGGYQLYSGAPGVGTPQVGIAPAPTPMPPGIVGDIGQIAGTAGNIYGLIQSYQLGQAGKANLAQANPFGAYRPMYGAQLAQLMQDPSSVANLPGYQFLMGQGTEAINRQAAGPGGVGFGSTADKALLEQYGQGLADQFYQQQVQTLSGLAGANITPANAAQMMASTGAAQGSMGAGLQSTLGSAANLINRFFPQAPTTDAYGNPISSPQSLYTPTAGSPGFPSYIGQPDFSGMGPTTGMDTSGGLAAGTPDWTSWSGDTGGAPGIDLGGMFQGD
jgi:hypothetical protein